MERRLVKDLDDLRTQIGELQVDIPISDDLTAGESGESGG